ncbi:MAG TPA: sugar phosphate isomerase/epimerase [Firmicutes bacterium]|nr:sugar phosphate isomerase/epimerase [Bacillota bacterium]
MKIGCCAAKSQLTRQGGSFTTADITSRLSWYIDVGVDFLELGVNWLAALEDRDLRSLVEALTASPLSVPACNLFLPGSMAIIGPNRDMAEIRRYLSHALARVEQLACPCVVFGSGGVRRFPDDYPADLAWRELKEFCLAAADEAARRRITIALEPLRYKECNVINSVATGYAYVDVIAHPHFRLLADTYHMEEIGEPLSVLTTIYPHLYHMHTADTGRVPPGQGNYPHAELFSVLKKVGYDKNISIECRWQDFDKELPPAIAHLKKAYASAT